MSLRIIAIGMRRFDFVLDSGRLMGVRLFERAQSGKWTEARSLTQLAAGRFGSGFRYPAWTLDLPPGKSVDLLLRLEGPSVVRFPLFLYDAIGFADRERTFDMIIGIALGIPLLLGVYVLSLRRFLDDASVPLFVGMLVSELVAASWISGFLQQLFPALPEHPEPCRDRRLRHAVRF